MTQNDTRSPLAGAKSVADLQADRDRRAEEQFPLYKFRVEPTPERECLVVVTSPAGDEYHVQPDGTCDCPDGRRWAEARQPVACKHTRMTEMFLALDPFVELDAIIAWWKPVRQAESAPAPRPRISREQMERDFPSD